MTKKSILIHNPRCGKSREAKKILEDVGVKFEVVEYLKDGLKEKMLKHLPKLLSMNFSEIVRSKEDLFKELKLNNKILSDEDWIKILLKNPILLERPIFIHNNKAIIGRPPERVLEILDK